MTADTMNVPTHRVVRATRPPEVTRASRPDRVAGGTGPLHVDRDSAPIWMRATGGVLLAVGTALSGAVLGWPGDAPETALLVPGLVAVVVGVLLLVARAGFDVTDDAVVLHFRPLPPRRIARRRIVDAHLVEADATTYGGLGLRRRHGVRALILTPGLGIEFTDDRGRSTFVRTHRPEDAFRALAD
ncbi:hypothetical protein [Curtobacterium sp. ISL-83]|uniref:hypothetical protein n=1 Tax=Curtobacterium sp. ISL-83 TaxID=2819145 RepID=UPI001BEA5AD6|nr:hypothetical protein [Curtobacterium sp. ISL-83]MBT2501988.1 hypothetical protein [Curtobacterium sp. ISL-83]